MTPEGPEPHRSLSAYPRDSAPIPVVANAWPAWTGWLPVLIGTIALLIALGGSVSAGSRGLALADPRTLLALAIGGGLLLEGGLVSLALRSLRLRRHLAPECYRGPSVLVLLVIAVVISAVVAIPFGQDAIALFGGGEATLLGSFVLLTSTQVALVAVSALFVFLPRALAGVQLLSATAWPRSAWIGFVAGVVAWLVATGLAALATVVLQALGVEPEPQAAEQAIAVLDPIVVIPAVVIIAPIAEEIFFRGVVFNAWLREYGVGRAMFGSALLFALIHASLVALVPILALGLGLALVYHRTRSLLVAIVMHATVNGVSVLLALLVRFDVIQLPT